MSARESFEDRLLAELKREIELREEVVAAPVPRRLLTRRRASLALAACAVAAAVAIAVPGSAGGSRAYAVERHEDGSVTLTIKERRIGVEDQRALARTLSRDDIEMVEWGARPVRCLDSVVLHPGDTVVLDNKGNPVRTADGRILKAVKLCPSR
ncbi:hypothetical protein ACH4U3_16915 [Streptomyces griseoruber]|uniref:hypothetical protein n=1 Tax=Streptomyces griseoruber TaxID=1943 RepID=UPI0037AAE00C